MSGSNLRIGRLTCVPHADTAIGAGGEEEPSARRVAQLDPLIDEDISFGSEVLKYISLKNLDINFGTKSFYLICGHLPLSCEEHLARLSQIPANDFPIFPRSSVQY